MANEITVRTIADLHHAIYFLIRQTTLKKWFIHTEAAHSEVQRCGGSTAKLIPHRIPMTSHGVDFEAHFWQAENCGVLSSPRLARPLSSAHKVPWKRFGKGLEGKVKQKIYIYNYIYMYLYSFIHIYIYIFEITTRNISFIDMTYSIWILYIYSR